DEEIGRLYDLFVSSTVNHQGWSFRREVLQCATRLLGNFHDFLNLQTRNPYLYGHNYEFLMDTLKFIATGRRDMSVHTWVELLAEHQAPQDEYRSRMYLSTLKAPLSVTGVSVQDVISNWCSKPKGFEDM